MKRKETSFTLLWMASCALAIAVPTVTEASGTRSKAKSTSAAQEEDYRKKITQPTVCGNQPYLDLIANDYRTACDRIASELRGTIRAAGAECDHIAIASPAIHATTASDVLCVVHGGDIVFGLPTNTARYLVFSERIERLPADPVEARTAIDASLARAISAQQAAAQQATAIRQEVRQKQIDANRMVTLADILSIRRERCDQLISVTKGGGGAFTATCLIKGREKKYEESITGLK